MPEAITFCTGIYEPAESGISRKLWECSIIKKEKQKLRWNTNLSICVCHRQKENGKERMEHV